MPMKRKKSRRRRLKPGHLYAIVSRRHGDSQNIGLLFSSLRDANRALEKEGGGRVYSFDTGFDGKGGEYKPKAGRVYVKK